MMRRICGPVVLVSLLGYAGLFAGEAAPARLKNELNVTWHGYAKTTFELEGCKCFVVAPSNAAAGNPWVWRTSFPDYHPEVDLALVAKGFHIGFIDCVKMLGCDAALDLMDSFYKVVTERWKLALKPALEPCSRGGLHAYRYAARHPERIACIYGDVPVMDLKSWPFKEPKAGGPRADAMNYYGFKSETDVAAFKGNPVDLLEPIAKAKIPLRHLIGLADDVVPPEVNTLEAKRRLQAMGHDLETVKVKDGKHHFPIVEVDQSVQFIMKHAGISK